MEHLNDLAKRYSVCYDRYGRAYRCNSAWNSWARWVALGVIVVAFFLLFFLCSCLTARRRRKAGRQPFYGTGWAGNTPFGHGRAQYNPSYQTQQPQYENAPPQYNQQQGGYHGGQGGAAQGYYGGGRDVEMQPPSNTYQGGENVYTPPSGPPPNKR